MKRDFRKPLVIFTPKKLLRYPAAVSKVSDFTNGGFKELIDDTSVNAKEVDTVIMVSGKFYYDIIEEKEKIEAGDNMAVVRLEQLYPLPAKQIEEIVAKYGTKVNYIWAQEEPENMGAWRFMQSRHRFWKSLGIELDVASRRRSASPASGSSKVSAIRHQAILDELMQYAKQKV